jgi:ubiquitin carboxyl-terminal hydrolase 7
VLVFGGFSPFRFNSFHLFKNFEKCYDNNGNENFKGLLNLRNTCYLNSIIQSLFHAKIFRDKIISSNFKENSIGESLQQLFEKLIDEQQNEAASPQRLANCLKINANLQEDAEEFYLKLLNGLDYSLVDTEDNKNNNNLTKLFQLKQEQFITCVNINATKIRSVKSLDLSVSLHNVFSLEDAIKEYFKVEHLNTSNANQYKHAQHGLQDAIKGVEIVEMPQILVVHFQRFAYDVELNDLKKVFFFFLIYIFLIMVIIM